MVYQGHAGGLDVEAIWQVGRVATAGLMPDLVFLLDMPPQAAVSRIDRKLDRMEDQGADFQAQLRQGFLDEAAADPAHIVVVDAARRSMTCSATFAPRQRACSRPEQRARFDQYRHYSRKQGRLWRGKESKDTMRLRTNSAARLLATVSASTFLFVGPAGIGKRAFAEKLAQALLCSEVPATKWPPAEPARRAGKCSCGHASGFDHDRETGGQELIPLSAFVGDDLRRMREGLCHDIALEAIHGRTPDSHRRRCRLSERRDANCLLKTLEEPPPHSVLILIGTSPDKQLPTIRSRAQVIRFQRLDRSVVADLLESRGLVADRAGAERLSEFAEGSLERALELADEDLWEFRGRLLDSLAAGNLNSVELSQVVVAFVEAAGKEASARRSRSRQLMAFAVDFHRQLLRALSGLPPQGDAQLLERLNRGVASSAFDLSTVLALVERSLEAISHVDRNAHQTTLLECWLDDLSRIMETGHEVENYSEV